MLGLGDGIGLFGTMGSQINVSFFIIGIGFGPYGLGSLSWVSLIYEMS